GIEDWNFDGAQTPFEGDLMDPSDDGDTDSDGVPDFAEDGCDLDNFSVSDEDSDSDGIADAIEGWPDTDSDGIPDFCDTDSDGDGIPDADEGEEDTDGDGIPNSQDTDSDDDGIPDAEESPVGDADCDGIPDVLDEVYEDQCDSNEDTGLNGDYGDLKGGTFSGGACSTTGSTPAGLLPFALMLAMLGFRRRGALLALLAPGAAQAEVVEQDNNSLAVNAQRFRAATDSTFFTFEDGHIGPAAELGASLLFNHARNPLVFRYDDPNESDFALLESVSTAELTTWYNLPSLRVGAVLPLHLTSSGYQVDGFRLLGDMRFLASWAALQSDNFNLTASADFTLPSGNEETWLGDDTSLAELSIQAGYRTEQLLAAAHLGYRYYADSVPLKDTDWGNRLTVGVGGAYRASDALQVTLEANGEFLSRTVSTAKATHTKPFEAMGGVRYALSDLLELSAGAGGGITPGVGAPDWRAIAGIHWNRSNSFASPASAPVAPALPEPTTEAEEEVVPTGWIRVIATNEASMPVTCSVRVLGTGEPPVRGGDDGWTELELTAGTHEVVVWAEGYQSFHTDIEVTAEGTTDINVVLPGGKVAIEGDQVRVFEKIFFELDSTQIRTQSFGILDEIVELLLNHPEITLMTIEGHTDDQGDAQYNVDLSFGRAEAVVHYLTAQGIERERLQARGLGESKPILPGESEESRAANRRVEFHIRERVPENP
ncbi:MAG: OmpA family protein, partial [Myxococcota bacterium]|nr:OmpA family protein [Myxococcota bacterium]